MQTSRLWTGTYMLTFTSSIGGGADRSQKITNVAKRLRLLHAGYGVWPAATAATSWLEPGRRLELRRPRRRSSVLIGYSGLTRYSAVAGHSAANSREDATASVDPAAVYRGALLRWRRQLSVTLQLGNACVLAHAVGTAPLVGAHAPLLEGDAASQLLLEE